MGHIANAMVKMVAADDSTGIRWGTPSARWVIGATVGASGLAMLDATAVNVALPAIGKPRRHLAVALEMRDQVRRIQSGSRFDEG